MNIRMRTDEIIDLYGDALGNQLNLDSLQDVLDNPPKAENTEMERKERKCTA